MCKSKQTFTQLHELGCTYEEWYIKVKWCLYPHIPNFNKTTYTYVKMVNKLGKNLKIFKIAKHENCSCNQPDKSPTGDDQYEAMRKAYIETLNVTDKGNSVNLPTQFNIFIIFIAMYYSICITCLAYCIYTCLSYKNVSLSTCKCDFLLIIREQMLFPFNNISTNFKHTTFFNKLPFLTKADVSLLVILIYEAPGVKEII